MQGDFTNTTPIKATFTEAGTYTIVLSLVNVADNNSIITSSSFTINVQDEETAPITNNTIINATNNTVTNELPKTGTSIGEYIVYFFVIGTIFLACSIYLNKKRHNN